MLPAPTPRASLADMTTLETTPATTSHTPLTPAAAGAPTPRQQRRARRIIRGVALVLVATFFIFAFAESWAYRGVVAVVLLAGYAIWRSAFRTLLPIVAAVVGVVGLIYIVGSYSRITDLAAVAAAAVVVLLLSALWMRLRPRFGLGPAQRWPLTGDASVALALGFIVASWLLLTTADTFAGRIAARRDWNAGRAKCPDGLRAPEVGAGRAPRVAIAVSGGGYRAALFHAGVLAGLECVRVPVSALSTVSGGSIIGSYYAVGGEPHAFKAMVSAGLFNLKRELLHTGNLLRFGRSLFADILGRDHPDTRFTQTDVQASLVDRLLYRGLRMADLDSLEDPRLLVNVTDLVSSERIAIGPRGVLTPTSHDPVNRQDYANPTGLVGGYAEFSAFREVTGERWPANEPLAKIVAASGAFPGAMRPVAVFVPSEPGDSTTTGGWYILADGGIADNTGLASVRDAMSLARDYNVYQRCASAYLPDSTIVDARCGERPWGLSPALNPWLVDIVVMSDGSAMSKAVTPTTTLAELGRTADVMYRMSGPRRPSPEDTTGHSPVLLISPKIFQAGGDDSVYWANPLEPSQARGAHRAYRSLHLWSYDLDVGTIRFMIEHMPEDEKARATEALRVVETEGRIRDGVWRGAGDPSQPPSVSERQLHDLLKTELRRRIAIFSATSTLRDQFEPETADAIFLLGQYLVMINRQSLQEQVARVSPRAPAPITAPVPAAVSDSTAPAAPAAGDSAAAKPAPSDTTAKP
jgi:predicted acylesterase/phospholipase RssA